MQLINEFNKGIPSGIFSKNTWVAPLKDKKSITITNVFQKNWMNKVAKRINYG